MWLLALALIASLQGDASFDAGCKLYDQLEYEQAVFRFQEVTLRPGLSPEDRATALAWLGLSYAGAGNPDAATRAFSDAARASAAVTLPVEVSPSLQQLFDDAKADVAAHPLPAPAVGPTTGVGPAAPVSGGAAPSPVVPGVGVAVGGAALFGGVALAAVSAVTYGGAQDKRLFQQDAKSALDTANVELGAAYLLIPAGLVVGGVSAFFLTESLQP